MGTQMKNIVLLKIATQFEIEHAFCLLFKVCKQSRRMMFSRIDYLTHEIPKQLSLSYCDNKLQDKLYYDSSLRIFEEYYSVKPINRYQHICLYPTTKLDIAKQIHLKAINDPRLTQHLISVLHQYFPNNILSLVYSSLISDSMTLLKIPNIFEIGFSQKKKLPIALLKQTESVVISVESFSFNLNFEGADKLGSNTTIKFNIIWDQITSAPPNTLFEMFNRYIDFEVCNYIIETGSTNNQFAKLHFEELQRNNIPIKGYLHSNYSYVDRIFLLVQGSLRYPRL
ncbi:hypothetical protein FGO68_gene13854 [Halteria grandinella]|uniref:Uncharacterized protein n=1 Tax=Halteria grandinella TaxID=5974 RepID=A0A8J8P3K8_HALGN|nr:hypothetical protein FGO68_gene13854 [Halteria grandinella]